VRYRLSDLVFESDRPLPELVPVPAEEANPEVRVTWNDARTLPLTGVQFSAWLKAEGGEWMTFADVPGGFLLTFPEHGQFEVTRDASAVSVHPFDEAPPETCDSCWLPGGYPELHAGRLVAAGRFSSGLAAFPMTRAGHGQCGGSLGVWGNPEGPRRFAPPLPKAVPLRIETSGDEQALVNNQLTVAALRLRAAVCNAFAERRCASGRRKGLALADLRHRLRCGSGARCG